MGRHQTSSIPPESHMAKQQINSFLVKATHSQWSVNALRPGGCRLVGGVALGLDLAKLLMLMKGRSR